MKKRTVVKTYNQSNITPQAQLIGANKGKPIKATKVVTTPNKVKTISYGAIGTYGKQERTKSIVKTKPSKLSDIRLNKSGTIGTEPIAKLDKKGNMRNYTEVKLGKLGSFSIKGKKIK